MNNVTVHVYNIYGVKVLTYENVNIENDLDPPYVILKSAKTGDPVALVPVSFVIEIVQE